MRSPVLREADVDELVAVYEEAYDLAPALGPEGDRRESLRDAARIEAGLRGFLSTGGFGAFTDTFEDLDGLRPATGDRSAAADGGRLRLRRRGGLEDGSARPGREGDEHRSRRRDVVHGGLHLRPCSRWPVGARGAHAGGLSVDRRREALVRDPPALDRRQGRSGAARVHGGTRPGGARGAARPRRPLPARPQRGRARRGLRRICRGCRLPGRSGGRNRTSPSPPRRGCVPEARTTVSSAGRSAPRCSRTSRR